MNSFTIKKLVSIITRWYKNFFGALDPKGKYVDETIENPTMDFAYVWTNIIKQRAVLRINVRII